MSAECATDTVGEADVGATAAPPDLSRGAASLGSARWPLPASPVIYLATRPTPVFDIRRCFGGARHCHRRTHGLLQETTREVRWVRSANGCGPSYPSAAGGRDDGTVAAVVIAGSSPLMETGCIRRGGATWLSVMRLLQR